jgi:uncharacterized protein YdeI (YjbR/CyaY-like superfamily)
MKKLSTEKQIPILIAYDRKDFRKWLRSNHNKETRVLIHLYKRHTKKPAPNHKELMEEAICYGWIDTTVKRIDENIYQRAFVKRNKNSKWSNATLGYAEVLIKKKLMTKAGLQAYKEGKAKPTIDHNLPKNPEIPDYLKSALKESKIEKEFRKLSPSVRRYFIWWLLRAKREETKEKRIKEIIRMVKEKRKIDVSQKDLTN